MGGSSSEWRQSAKLSFTNHPHPPPYQTPIRVCTHICLRGFTNSNFCTFHCLFSHLAVHWGYGLCGMGVPCRELGLSRMAIRKWCCPRRRIVPSVWAILISSGLMLVAGVGSASGTGHYVRVCVCTVTFKRFSASSSSWTRASTIAESLDLTIARMLPCPRSAKRETPAMATLYCRCCSVAAQRIPN